MDPNETVKLLFEASKLFSEEKFKGRATRSIAAASDMVMHLHNLDAWLTDGGFLPECWDCARPYQDEDDE